MGAMHVTHSHEIVSHIPGQKRKNIILSVTCDDSEHGAGIKIYGHSNE